MIFDPTTQANIDLWLNGDYDEETKQAVAKLVETDPAEAVNAFYRKLSFGTGGLRGIVGVGTNRLNRYTIMTATQGLANYLNKQPLEDRRVLIGFDSRDHSFAFAQEAAAVLAANGIEVHLFRELRPTPLVSFGCRKLACCAAIVMTASHNPACYNGYKVYWRDGGQMVPPQDQEIMAEIHAITSLQQIAQRGRQRELIHWVGEELDRAYLEETSLLQGYPQQNREQGHSLSVVYTPLHGTGSTLVPAILDRWGFTKVKVVPQQEKPDGKFPTVKQPNPEEEAALQLGIDLLEAVEGDLLLATDPDADRVGVVVRHRQKAVVLDGNQIACLCLEHICSHLRSQGRMPPSPACIKTLVTTEMMRAIAQAYGLACFDVLTGFKWIAHRIHQWEEEETAPHFLFGSEESCGYLRGTVVRDKDAVTSCALICEMALWAKLRKKTLVDLLHDLYRKYGIYRERLLSLTYPETKEGHQQMKSAIEKLRKNPPTRLGKAAVVQMEDYLTPLHGLPKADVLRFRLEEGSWVAVRPSGTEPKIKVYGGASQALFSSMDEAIRSCEERVDTLLQAVAAAL